MPVYINIPRNFQLSELILLGPILLCELEFALTDMFRIGSSAQHLHLVGDDLGCVAIVAAVVLPLAGFDLALEVGLRA